VAAHHAAPYVGVKGAVLLYIVLQVAEILLQLVFEVLILIHGL
jgi:hypothetical protein